MLLPCRTSRPPKYNTQHRTSTPRNSDKGDARSFLNIILFLRCVRVSLLVKNFVRCIFSALNALITLRPPSVSSRIDISVPISSCDCVDCLRRERLTLPMMNPVRGRSISRNSESWGLKNINTDSMIRMVSGSFINPSSVLMMLHSISFVSLLIRLVISPLRCSVK